MQDPQLSPKRKRQQESGRGFEVFVCGQHEESRGKFVYAEQLRGLALDDIAYAVYGSAYVLTANKEVKQWGGAKWSTNDFHKHGVLKYKSLIDEPIAQIAAGFDYFVAVGQRGAVYSWGNGNCGKLGHNSETHVESPKKIVALKDIKIVQVSCGDDTTVFLSNDGQVYTCGDNSDYVLGDGNLVGKQLVPRLVGGLKGKFVVQISVSHVHAAAVTDQFDLYAWGYGKGGCLGHSDEAHQPTPKVVGALRGKAQQVSCGGRHTAVIAKDGLYSFGDNRRGQLGHGDLEDRWEPTLVRSLGNDAQQVFCGASRTACIVGKSLCTWGDGRFVGHGDTGNHPSPKKVEALKDCQVSHVVMLPSSTIAFIDPNTMAPGDCVPVVSALASMINNKELSDVSFLVDQQQIFALKGILIKRCPYFNTMFASGMRESSNQHNIPISNVRKEIFLLLLEFLYTDAVNMEPEDAIDLYVAADVFQLMRLKNICLSSLENDLCADNAGSVLGTAALCGYEEPKTLCMNFLVENFREVSKTKGFKQLRCPDLLHEVFAAISDEYCTDTE